MILVQPSCKSSEESINPDLTAPETAQENPVAVEGTLAPEGSDQLRVPPTRPVHTLSNRSVNEIPTDTFVQPEPELIAPTTTTLEPEVIEPKTNAKPEAAAPMHSETVRYVIKRGDNLTKIAKANDTTVGAIMEANKMQRNQTLIPGKSIIIPISGSSAPVAAQAIESSSASSSVYVVQKGDSLSKIAGKYNTSVGKIMNLNGMNNTSIRIGQKLKIPAASAASSSPSSTTAAVPVAATGNALTHKVASGETLGGIAIKHKVPLKALMDLNGIKDARKLRAGQVLVIKKDANEGRQAATTFTPAKSDTSVTIGNTANDSGKVPGQVIPSVPGTINVEQDPKTVPSGAVTPAPEIIEESVDL
jgi:LysM repeat protein